jgi:hypothetical protein
MNLVSDGRRWVGCWSLLTAGLVLVIFTGGIVFPAVFHLIGINPLKPIFSDLIAILAAGEAHISGMDPYAHNPLDPFNRPHVYGPWWLVVGNLGLVRADAWWLGLLLAVTFLFAAVKVLSPSSRAGWLMAVALLVSPPVMLALERGNNDLVIFILLVAAVWAATRKTITGSFVGGGLVVLAAALKLYPLAVLPAMASRATSRVRALGFVGLTLLACLVVVAGSWTVYQKVMAMAPEPMTIFGYGAKLTYYVLLTISDQRVWFLLGGAPTLLAILWTCWLWRRNYWDILPVTGFTTGVYLAGALSWSLCYVSTINFPYRMILLLLPARLWLKCADAIPVRWQWSMAVLLVWTPCFKEHLLVLSPDESSFTGSFATWMVLGAEHALALGLTVSLGLVMLGWLWRRFCPPTGI